MVAATQTDRSAALAVCYRLPRVTTLGSTVHPLASSPAGTVSPRKSRLAKIGVTFLSGAGTIAGPMMIGLMAASRCPFGACRDVVHWLDASEASRRAPAPGESVAVDRHLSRPVEAPGNPRRGEPDRDRLTTSPDIQGMLKAFAARRTDQTPGPWGLIS